MSKTSSTHRVTLGITCFHGDSSAALAVDGRLVAAAEEERFSRLKHTAAFPRGAIAYCLARAGLKAQDVEVVAIPGSKSANVPQKLLTALKNPAMAVAKLMRPAGEGPKVEDMIAASGLGDARIERFEHHLAHMASVRILDPEQPMLLLSLDGLGDFVSAACGFAATGAQATISERVHFPSSLGFFYTALTQHLGFMRFGEEFKVMGLSSFGQPRYVEPLRRAITTGKGFGFTLDPEVFPLASQGVPFRVEKDQPLCERLYDVEKMTALLGIPARAADAPLTDVHRDLAMSLQARFEEVADHLLQEARKLHPARVLGLAGGCSHNSVWVGKIKARHGFDAIHVAPASHDAGLAVGVVALANGGKLGCDEPHWALLGPSQDDPGYEAPPAPSGTVATDWADDETLQAWIATELAAGKIVGLYHGRMEFGPRALGSRSILCDPRPLEMRDRLNARVKHREAFRPFAAAVLAEKQDAWFEDAFYAPSMEAVFPVRAAQRGKIAAVTHADGSCRIQSIRRDTQPFLWGVIERFEALTGVPMLINTSFNDSEPIVCTPREALDCYLRTEMDYVVIGRRGYVRHGSRP